MGNRLILCTGGPLYLENVVVTTRYLGFQIMEVKTGESINKNLIP